MTETFNSDPNLLTGGEPIYLMSPYYALPPGYQYPTEKQVSSIIDLIIKGQSAAVAAAAIYGGSVSGYPTVTVVMSTSPTCAHTYVSGLTSGQSIVSGIYVIAVAPIPGTQQWTQASPGVWAAP